jgi:hypothetical protein
MLNERALVVLLNRFHINAIKHKFKITSDISSGLVRPMATAMP